MIVEDLEVPEVLNSTKILIGQGGYVLSLSSD
jgi:hypothetical protein